MESGFHCRKLQCLMYSQVGLELDGFTLKYVQWLVGSLSMMVQSQVYTALNRLSACQAHRVV